MEKNLTQGQKNFLKIKAWTLIYNALSNIHGWAYRYLPFEQKKNLLNKNLLTQKTFSNAQKQINPIMEKLVKKGVIKTIPQADKIFELNL